MECGHGEKAEVDKVEVEEAGRLVDEGEEEERRKDGEQERRGGRTTHGPDGAS